MGFGVENDLLLALLREAIKENANTEYSLEELFRIPEHSIDWRRLVYIAKQHSVLSFLYPVCGEEDSPVPDYVQKAVQRESVGITKHNYRLLFMSKYLITKLREAGIDVVLLKGVATASFYPVPEYRKSGDVDLLLTDVRQLDKCCAVLESCGCIQKERQAALHHVSYQAADGTEVELHTLLAEPFDNRKMNRYLERLVPTCAKQIYDAEIMGVTLPILNVGYHGYELLLHMLQHFLRAGFGLKFLCDWVVFWRREVEQTERELYLRLVKESGLKGFSDMVTQTCCEYLGLDADCVSWMKINSGLDTEELLHEILEAEEFGRSSTDRMVVMQGNGLWDYFREFHHQMRLTYPKLGKWFFLWPILWMKTFLNFVNNNKKVRNVSTKAIFRKAAQRSKIIQQMKLWKY